MIRTMNTFTNAVQRARKRIHAADLRALARWFTALVLLTIATLASAASWDDDSHYVPLGPRTGYYIVRPGSQLSRQLGVEAAPTIDTADPFRHDMELMQSPSASITLASYPRRQRTSSKPSRMSSTLCDLVP
jgi:hypothetical protein